MHSLFQTSQKSGFTFIELLIVIAITGIVIGGSAASYRRFNNRQIVITSGKELLVELRQSQSKINSGVKTAPGCNTTPLAGYRVQAVAGSLNRYQVIEVYRSACAAGGATTFTTKDILLPSGVTFQSAFSVTFLGLSGGATFTGASPLTVRMCNNSCGAGALSYVVAINQAGLIEDQGAQ